MTNRANSSPVPKRTDDYNAGNPKAGLSAEFDEKETCLSTCGTDLMPELNQSEQGKAEESNAGDTKAGLSL